MQDREMRIFISLINVFSINYMFLCDLIFKANSGSAFFDKISVISENWRESFKGYIRIYRKVRYFILTFQFHPAIIFFSVI